MFVSLKPKFNQTISQQIQQSMNAPSKCPQTKTRHSGRTRRFNYKLATGLAFACLGAALLLPVLKSRTGYHHRMPPGQFQADMRTMIAGVRYLLQSEETT